MTMLPFRGRCHTCGHDHEADQTAFHAFSALLSRAQFRRGDIVRKRSGSQWQGRVVGEYSTTLTPEGYAVESEAHAGSVQIYPAAALELIARCETPNAKFTGPSANKESNDEHR